MSRKNTTGDLEELRSRLREMASQSQKLPNERQLCEILGMNRYRIRQALAQLRDMDDLPALRKRSVLPEKLERNKLLANTNPVEMWELRLAFEPEIARLAALRATPDQLQKLNQIHLAANPTTFDLEQDIAFHTAIAAASSNSLMQSLIALITDMTRDPSFRMQLPRIEEETGYAQHVAILEAISRRKPQAAAVAMHHHLQSVLGWLTGQPGEFSLTSEQRELTR